MDTAQTLEKRCSKCKVVYPVTTEYFGKNSRYKRGFQRWCRKCYQQYAQDHKENTRIRRAKRKEQYPLYDFQSTLKSNYGISLTDYNKMLVKQNNCCVICGKPETAKNQYGLKRLGVDHDHITGQIRGLLCYKCNLMLGLAGDNINTLESAIQYLQV